MTLPTHVKRRQAEKRQDGSVIGVCGKCNEETWANKDGILRDDLFTGIGKVAKQDANAKCVDGKGHVIRRFYISGPSMWMKKWGHLVPLPDWAQYLREQEQGAK